MLVDLKILLGITESDMDMDNKLELIVSTTKARLSLLLKGIEPPESMNHIILEVSVMRFNRIGSEGLKSHSVEGESQQFVDSDFAQFADEIQAFLETQEGSTKGRVRFL